LSFDRLRICRHAGRIMRIGLRLCLGLMLILWPAISQAQFESPRAAVEALYALYLNDGPGLSSKPAEVRRFLEVRLADAWLRDAKDKNKKLDYDPFVQGQDYQVAALSVREENVAADLATARADFRNFGRQTTVVYQLVRGRDGWRINDAIHKGRSLRRIFRLD